ncbi:MAG: hypothetical protein ACRDH2_11250 [Anaerolineales bacterium]
MDPSVMVAVIGAMVTIITAALSSPLLLTLVGRMNAPAPTAAAAAILPSLASSTHTVPSASATPSALTETVALPTPESTPTPATSQPASLFECIASDTWTPYPSNLNPNESNGCWELGDWGLTTQDGQLRIDHTPTQPQQRGIYLPLSGNMDVHFTVQFDEFRVRSNRQALLTFGVVQREPFSHFSGGFLSYSQSQPGAANIQVLVSGSNQATQRLPALDFGVKQRVTLSVRAALLTVYLDGQPAGDLVNVAASNRALWIGYLLPANGKLQVAISGFAIQPQP